MINIKDLFKKRPDLLAELEVKNVNNIMPIVKVNILLGQIKPLKCSLINLMARIDIWTN